MINKLFLFLLLLTINLVACGEKDDPVQATGCEGSEEMSLENLTGLLDGCGWVLNRADGTRIEPLNLGDFNIVLENGKAVQVVYDIDSTAASICLVGDIVRLTCMED